MGSYLLTILVTLEQEEAIQQLFHKNEWKYTKQDSKISQDYGNVISEGKSVTANVTDSKDATDSVLEEGSGGKSDKKGNSKVNMYVVEPSKGDTNSGTDDGSGSQGNISKFTLRIDLGENKACNDTDGVNKPRTKNRKSKRAVDDVSIADSNLPAKSDRSTSPVEDGPESNVESSCLSELETDPDILHYSEILSSSVLPYEASLSSRLDSGFNAELSAYVCKDCYYVFMKEPHYVGHKRDGKCVFPCGHCNEVFSFRNYSKFQEHLGNHRLDDVEVPPDDSVEVEEDTTRGWTGAVSLLKPKTERTSPVDVSAESGTESLNLNTGTREKTDGTLLDALGDLDMDESLEYSLEDILEADEADDTASLTEIEQESEDENVSTTDNDGKNKMDNKQEAEEYVNNTDICKNSTDVDTNSQGVRNKLTCDICGRRYRSDTALKAHKKFHGVHEYSCDVCNKSFPILSYLKRHLVSHTGARHKCKECGKVFSRVYTLQQHVSVKHEKNSKLECKPCGKHFTSKEHMLGHLVAKHGVEKRFSCSKCGKKFGYKKNMVHHVEKVCGKVKEVPRFQCDVCGKPFPSNKSLKQHIVLHSDPEFECEKCSRKFHWRASYRKHLEVCGQRLYDEQDPCQMWIDLHSGSILDQFTQTI